MKWTTGILYFFDVDDDEAQRWYKPHYNFESTEIMMYKETIWKDA